MSNPVSILIVDDEPRNIVALEAALASVDCTLVRAGSGREALRASLAQDFAVIVLDVHMPGMDGFETATVIRTRERSRTTPIIFLTAYDRTESRTQEGYRLGAVDFIYKPFDAHILRAKATFFVELFRKTVELVQRTTELTHVTANLVVREHQVGVLNASLELRVAERTAALVDALNDLEEEAVERLRAEETLRAVERAASHETEIAVRQASALADVSRVLVESFMDHRPMLARVAQIAAVTTDSACVIQLIAEDSDDAGLAPLAVGHASDAVRAELARVLSPPHTMADSPWQELDPAFWAACPLTDSLLVPMLARTAMIGILSLGRFGLDAPLFTESDRRFADDLAARVALAVENARLYDNARRAIELRDNFLSIAAHELRTPLTTIQGYSQLLSLQLEEGLGQDSEAVHRSARLIEDRTRDLTRLVDQILDVSKLVASRLKLTLSDTDLVGLMSNLVARFRNRHPSLEFRLNGPCERLQAPVDPVRLEQVMANLIDNAVRYSSEGGAIDITIEQLADNSACLSVRDRGPGIPEEHRAHIFDRFHQAHAVNYRSGLGLGLHISREIVTLHGGRISVTFPADGGSQFNVCLAR